MHKATLLLATTTVLAAIASQAAPGAQTSAIARTANSVTFQDSVAEEDARAPDVSTVIVSNDDAGLLSFEIHFATRPTPGPGEELSLWFDTDSNFRTGLLGSERFIELIGSNLTLTDINSFDVVSAPSLSASAAASSVTIRVRANELGVAAPFVFYVWTDATPD